MPLAHSDCGFGGHDLEEHLRSTARRAAEFAGMFGGANWAELAGLWHDVGKYDSAFQGYLLRAVGKEDAHLEAEEAGSRGPARGPEHSIAGAVHAIERFGEGNGRLLAYCIAGHHAGLADWNSTEAGQGSLEARLRRARENDMLGRAKVGGAPAALLDAAPPTGGPRGLNAEECAFFIRMLFSALVDADFLDTEAHFDRQRGDTRAGWPSLDALLPVLDAYLDAKTVAALRDRPGPVNEARREVLGACRAGAALSPGLFTMTVPTGGGKTLASLAFALRHAQAHGLRRVIYAIPYTSIIEQTADVFREVFASLGEVVVEHHSSLAPEHETNRSRLAAENWDAPLVVTTTVQLFESLFAARVSHCRKLHNIARSVLILDEAQLLPVEFLRPILFALDELMARYGVSVLLSTATQPALLARGDFKGLTAYARELAPEPERLRQSLRRVRVERLHGLDRRIRWDELTELIAAESRALCIVDRRDSARDLTGMLPDGTFHLSALMCPQHRSEVLTKIRQRLGDRQAEVRVVATQLVEAGVDLDFPVVFRAVAGLDSVAQAAGRCNREGQLAEGRLVVFAAPKPPPDGVLRQAAAIAERLLRGDDEDPLTLAAFTRFFTQLYWVQGDRLDSKQIISGYNALLARSRLQYAFRTAAEVFRIIPDEQVPVVVPWGDARLLVREVERAGASRGRLRRLQRFTVGVYRRTAQGLLTQRVVREILPGLLVLEDERLYDEFVGLDVKGLGVLNPQECIV